MLNRIKTETVDAFVKIEPGDIQDLFSDFRIVEVQFRHIIGEITFIVLIGPFDITERSSGSVAVFVCISVKIIEFVGNVIVLVSFYEFMKPFVLR